MTAFTTPAELGLRRDAAPARNDARSLAAVPGEFHRRPKLRWLVPLLFAAFFAGCATSGSPSAKPGAPSYIALERTAGRLAEAPVYLVTLYSDGGVLFEGRANVRSKGTFTKRIPPESAAALFTQLDAIDFWNRWPRYDEDRTKRGNDDVIVAVASPDVPWDILSARHRGRFKRIDGLFYAPRELTDFKRRFEEVVGLADWIGPGR